jgi:hypothetical protein
MTGTRSWRPAKRRRRCLGLLSFVPSLVTLNLDLLTQSLDAQLIHMLSSLSYLITLSEGTGPSKVATSDGTTWLRNP